jgi:hypothetical protein
MYIAYSNDRSLTIELPAAIVIAKLILFLAAALIAVVN